MQLNDLCICAVFFCLFIIKIQYGVPKETKSRIIKHKDLVGKGNFKRVCLKDSIDLCKCLNNYYNPVDSTII